MNKNELFFVAISVGLGVGVGAKYAKSYGFMGFIVTFISVIILLLLMVGAVRMLAPKKKYQKNIRNKPRKRIDNGDDGKPSQLM